MHIQLIRRFSLPIRRFSARIDSRGLLALALALVPHHRRVGGSANPRRMRHGLGRTAPKVGYMRSQVLVTKSNRELRRALCAAPCAVIGSQAPAQAAYRDPPSMHYTGGDKNTARVAAADMRDALHVKGLDLFRCGCGSAGDSRHAQRFKHSAGWPINCETTVDMCLSD